MKLFKRNQSMKKQEENYNKILNESELEPYSYTPTLDAEDIPLDDKDSLLNDGEIESRYVNNFANNSQQSFTVMSGKDDTLSTINKRDSHFNEIQQREVNNKYSSFVIRDSQLYGDDISSIHGEAGGQYDDVDSLTDNNTTITNGTKASTQFSNTKTIKDEMSETTTNYQNSSENNYTNLQTQSIYATPIFSGFLYKLGRNKRWQWRMFCFDGMSLACLSSKCKPKYVIPLDKVESIKLLHRNAPEYKPNTFVITVEKNDCKGKMDDGFFPYSETSIPEDPLRPKRTFSRGYYSYLLRAKTSVDLERWMFVLLTMYSVMKREKMSNYGSSFSISNSPPQPLFSFTSSNSSDHINTSFHSRNDYSYNRGRVSNDYGNTSNTQESQSSDSLRQIKIPSLTFAPPLSTMITSQYKDRIENMNSHGSNSNSSTPPTSANSSAKNSATKLNNAYSSPSSAKESKVEIISAQRYRDPNYNPVNYTSDLSNLRLESRRNKGDKSNKPFRNPYVTSSTNNSNSNLNSSTSNNNSNTPNTNSITIRAVNSLGTNTVVSPTSLTGNNSPPPIQQPRKSSLNSPMAKRPSPRNSPKSARGLNNNHRTGRESVIVSSIMQDFIFNDFDKNVEIDESLKEYAVQSLRLFSLAEQKAAVENVQQAWNLGREDDDEMLDILVQELRKTPVKVENGRESIVSQMALVEIMDEDEESEANGQDPSKPPPDNTFISFAVGMEEDEEGEEDGGDDDDENSRIYRNRSTGHMNKRQESKRVGGEVVPKQDHSQGQGHRRSVGSMNSAGSRRSSAYVQKAWRNSIASLLNLDNEMNVSLGLSNFRPTLSRKNGELRGNPLYRTSSLPMEKGNDASAAAEYNKSLGRGENNAITPRRVVNTRLASNNSLNRGKAVYLGDIAEEVSDSDDSDSEDDDMDRPVRKDSMNPRPQKRKNRVSYIPRGRPFSYYLGKNNAI